MISLDASFFSFLLRGSIQNGGGFMSKKIPGEKEWMFPTPGQYCNLKSNYLDHKETFFFTKLVNFLIFENIFFRLKYVLPQLKKNLILNFKWKVPYGIFLF